MLPTVTSIIFLFLSGIQIWRLCVQIPVVYETPTETFIIVAGNIIWNALPVYIFFIRSYSNDIDPLARKYILQKPFYTQTVKICYFCFFWHKYLTLEFFEPIQEDALHVWKSTSFILH